jgi:hypothetical protein
MNDISDLTAKGLPSTQSLLKATAVALVVATLILVFVVLPAEYGFDPTGVGARIGLTAMSDAEAAADDEEAAPRPTEAANAVQSSGTPISVLDAVAKADRPFRTDEMSLTLQPNEGGEIKALMQAGERFVFSWQAEGGGLNFDMHGEELNAANDEFTSYWKGRDETSGHGAFQAPFAGTHGWYWRNRGTAPVTVRVKTSGYYEKLFKP